MNTAGAASSLSPGVRNWSWHMCYMYNIYTHRDDWRLLLVVLAYYASETRQIQEYTYSYTAQMLIATATNVPAQCLPSHVCIVRTSIELSVSSHNTNDHVACMHIVALGSGAPWTPVYSYVLHCYTARPSVRSFHLTTTSSSYTLVFSPSR